MCQEELFTSRPLTKILHSFGRKFRSNFFNILEHFSQASGCCILFFKDHDESGTTSEICSLAHFSIMLLARLVLENNELARLIKFRLILIFIPALRSAIFSTLYFFRSAPDIINAARNLKLCSPPSSVFHLPDTNKRFK